MEILEGPHFRLYRVYVVPPLSGYEALYVTVSILSLQKILP